MRIGIDLGGTKIAALALDAAGDAIARRRAPTPVGDYAATIENIAAMIAEIETEVGRRGSIGIGIPGAPSPATGLIKNANSTWLIGKPFEADLAAALGRPVRLANDADCFALSEAADGAAAGAPVVFGTILGTGVGGGIVVDGKLLAGANAIAGEWGHNPLPSPADDERPGPECYCGRSGCIETFLSGPGMAADHRLHAGEETDAREIARRAQLGDAAALATLTRYADRLARALAMVINVIDPQCIVFGGGLSNIDFLYEAVPALWPRHVFSDTVATRLVAPRYGDASGARGAAWLWPVGSETPV